LDTIPRAKLKRGNHGYVLAPDREEAERKANPKDLGSAGSRQDRAPQRKGSPRVELRYPTPVRRLGAVIPIDLSGHVAVITGASGELGRVMARTLAEAGAAVAVHYFSGEKRAHELVEQLRARAARAISVQADVTQPSSVSHLRETVTRQLGDADIIVNNAVVQ